MIHFGLKNVGETHQLSINKVFKHQIGYNIEAYIDDMLVKSIYIDWHIDMEEVFDELRWNQMKLNPNKCAFGMILNNFLGSMVI